MKLVDKGGWFAAENAVVVGPVRVGRGSSLWYGVVVRADMGQITIGEYCDIQDLSVLHCDPGKDLVIGDFVTAGHHAMVHARRVGSRTLVGIGSILLGGCDVGEGCLIAAGALVLEDQVVPPRSIVVGVPGKIVGRTTDEQVAGFEERARRYYENALRHERGAFSGS